MDAATDTAAGTVYTLTLHTPKQGQAAVLALRLALKVLKRRFGLTCLSMKTQPFEKGCGSDC